MKDDKAKFRFYLNLQFSYTAYARKAHLRYIVRLIVGRDDPTAAIQFVANRSRLVALWVLTALLVSFATGCVAIAFTPQVDMNTPLQLKSKLPIVIDTVKVDQEVVLPSSFNRVTPDPMATEVARSFLIEERLKTILAAAISPHRTANSKSVTLIVNRRTRESLRSDQFLGSCLATLGTLGLTPFVIPTEISQDVRVKLVDESGHAILESPPMSRTLRSTALFAFFPWGWWIGVLKGFNLYGAGLPKREEIIAYQTCDAVISYLDSFEFRRAVGQTQIPAIAEAKATPPEEKPPPAPPPSPPPSTLLAQKPQVKPPAEPDYARLQAARRVALVIGIDQYAHYPALRSAVGDARGVATILRANYGFSEVRELVDAQATRAGILEALRSLTVAVRKGDGVLLFFAGHGEYDDALSRGAWVPVEAQSSADFLPNSEIYDHVKEMDKRGAGHVLIIADSCFSGSLLDTTRSADRGLGVRPAAAAGAELPRWLEKLAASPSRRALTSGSIEPVADSGGGGHSPFTRCLLEALRNPEHDAFTATELAAKVQRLVGLNSEQTPRYGVIRFAGDMAGEFVFVKSGR